MAATSKTGEFPLEKELIYKPKDAISATVWATVATGSAGTFVSAIQNSLARTNVGASGIFWRTGGTIAIFAGVGGAYAFTKTASANLREKDDTWNSAVGGFFGGSILGLRARTFPAVLGAGAALSVILAAYEFTGGALYGDKKAAIADDVARKEALRRNRRRPIEETIAEMGEGRGIYGPGYEERRAQRIKERYGIDVNPGAPQDPKAL